MNTIKNNILFLVTIPIIVLLGFLYYQYSPSESNFFPKCPINYLTGFKCPGCGSQRAIHELLHFNFKNAFSYNALLVIGLPYLVLTAVFKVFGLNKRFPKTGQVLFGTAALTTFIVVAILYGICRNF